MSPLPCLSPLPGHRLQVSDRFRPLVLVALVPLLGCLLLAASGCGMLAGPGREAPPPRPMEQTLEQRAQAAWEARDYAASAQLYRDLAEQSGLTPQQRSQAWERAVISAIENRQYHLALESMPKWRQAVPDAAETDAWQDAYFRTLDGLGDPGVQETELLALSSDESLPWRMRARAGIVLAVLHWQRGDVRRPQMILSLIQQQAKQRGQEALATIENMLLAALPAVKLQDLEAFELLIPEEDRTVFPYTIVQLEKARRLAATPGGRSQAYTLVQRVAPFLADRTLGRKVLSQESSPEGPADRFAALALPLTGPYGEVASKILRGAMAAQKDLAAEGQNVDVQVINTHAETWQQDLANLPPDVAVVGGPLRVDVFKQLMNTQLPRQRAFFACLSGLGSATEGRDAWRFFTSAEDQVRTLVDTARQDFGVSSTAVIYPQDSYGMHMAQLYRQEAMGQRLAVTASESYSPRSNENWSSLVANVARSGAASVFIPGDWEDAEQLAPYLPYHDASDMLILGPSLWGPSIDRKGYVEISTFAKAVFPGAWWPENPAPAAMALKRRMQDEGQTMPDFWTALGYDFVRFAAMMHLAPGWTPDVVNQRIQAAQGMSWSQAPILWSSHGQAAQQLFPLRLTQNGYTLAQPPALEGQMTPLPESENSYGQPVPSSGQTPPTPPQQSPSYQQSPAPSGYQQSPSPSGYQQRPQTQQTQQTTRQPVGHPRPATQESGPRYAVPQQNGATQ